MRRPFPLGLLLTLVASAAGAVETPHPGHADARVRTIDYDPAQVVRISGAYRTAIQILFDENETIQHVAVGDATAWDAVAANNILFIKPKAAHGITDLIVTTSRPNGDERDYTFELTTGVRRRSGGLYVLRFRYPSDLKASSERQLSIAERALQTKLMTLNLEHGAIEGARNLAYTVQGSAALQPSEVSDNGRFTVMRFPAGQAIPTVYEIAADGAERLVPFDVRGEFVVVHDIVRQLRLRLGREVLCIYNEGPPTLGVNLGTYTASGAIDRVDRGSNDPTATGREP